MVKIKKLKFHPLPGIASRHLQTVLAAYRPSGPPPPSKSWLVDIGKGDFLSCEVSIPDGWREEDPTIALVHGLGGCHTSNYMVRLSRKLYAKGYKIVRVNLRGAGTGEGLSKLPYNGGTSKDVLRVLQYLQMEAPDSPVTLIGFSLGGNVTLKLAGELGEKATKYVKMFIAVCPPLDMRETERNIAKRQYAIYQAYYLDFMLKQTKKWSDQHEINSIYEFDDNITAPLWGYSGAQDYYEQCSSIKYIPKIKHTTHILFAEDDPFVQLDILEGKTIPKEVHIWTTKHGGHMGFMGQSKAEHNYHWLDHILLNWISGDFKSDLEG